MFLTEVQNSLTFNYEYWREKKINHDAIDISNDYPCNFTSKAQIDSFYA